MVQIDLDVINQTLRLGGGSTLAGQSSRRQVNDLRTLRRWCQDWNSVLESAGCWLSHTTNSQQVIIVGYMFASDLDPLPSTIQVLEGGYPPERPDVPVVLEFQGYEDRRLLFDAFKLMGSSQQEMECEH